MQVQRVALFLILQSVKSTHFFLQPKSNLPSSENWPSFDAPPPLPGSTITGTSTPMSSQQGMRHPVSQIPMDGSTSMHPTGTPSTVSAVQQVHGSRTPSAPGYVIPQHLPGLNHFQIPIYGPNCNNEPTSPFVQEVIGNNAFANSAKVNHGK